MRTASLQHGNQARAVRTADLDLLHSKTDAATFVRKITADDGGYLQSLRDNFVTNCDYLEGGYKQWQEWTENGERKIDPAIGKFNDKVVAFNWIQEIVDTLVARHMRPMGLPKSSGVTTFPEDVRKARKQTDVLRWIHQQGLQGPILLTQFLIASFCADVVFLNIDWSAYCGRIVQTSLEEFVAGRLDSSKMDPESAAVAAVQEFVKVFGESAAKKRKVVQYEGDLKGRVLTPMEMYWYPRKIKNWKHDLIAVVEEEDVPVELAAERAKMSVDEIRRRATGETQSSPFDSVRVDAVSNDGDIVRDAEIIRWRRMQHKPTIEYPEGVECVVLGNDSEAIMLGPLRNKLKRLSYIPYSQKLLADRAVGKCVLTDLRSLGRDTNRWACLRTLMAELNVFGQWAIPEDGISDPNNWRKVTAPGAQQKIRTAAGKPINMRDNDATLPADAIIGANVEAGRQIAGVGYISAGQPGKAGTLSGRAMNSMDEKIAERDVPNIVRLGFVWSEAYENAIVEYMDKAGPGRTADLVSDDSDIEVMEFDAEEIRPSTWGKPGRRLALVTVQMDTDSPMAPSERRNFTLAYLKALRSAGIPVAGAQADQLINQGDLRLFEDKDRTHRNRANLNIERWRKGELASPPIRAWRPDIHLEEIEAWQCRGDEYEELVSELPYLAEHIEQHIRQLERLVEYKRIRPMLTAEVARVEAWMEVFANIEADCRAGILDQKLMQFITPGPMGEPPILLPLSSILQLGMSAPMPVSANGQAPEAGPNGQPQRGGMRQRRETTEKIGDGEQRNEHRDMSEQGYDRQNLANAKP